MKVRTELAMEHLLLRLRPLNRALRAAVERQGRAAARLLRPDVTPLCITADQAEVLLKDVEALPGDAIPADLERTLPTPDQEIVPAPTKRSGFFRNLLRGIFSRAREQEANLTEGEPTSPQDEPEGLACHLQTSAEMSQEEIETLGALRARTTAHNLSLPLEQLSREMGLAPFEEEALLLCLAPEVDRSYERIYAFILDDLNRRYPCVELFASLTASSLLERLHRRHALGRFGLLQRAGILQTYGAPATELRQELRLAPGLFDYLTGGIGEMPGRFRDPGVVPLPEPVELPPQVDPEDVTRLTESLRAGTVSVIGLWGPPRSGPEEAAQVIASRLGRSLRRFIGPAAQQSLHLRESVGESFRTASALAEILWIATDPLTEPGAEALSQALAEELAASQAPALLTGTHPWRPLRLLESRAYAEIELDEPGFLARKAMWSVAFPEAHEDQIDDLSARFRVSGPEMRAAVRMAKTQALVTGGSADLSADLQIEPACAAVARKRSHQFATFHKPKRGPDELILPQNLHSQVMEVAQFYLAWPRVSEDWGFGRLTTGNGAVKALFTGDSGTGKTLAAEVIAGLLGMPLLKVDLAKVVSKWVGETSKHLEAAFKEAEDSQCVLFFDECDSLFGKRGEVERGVDRYANLEVSYLLQRLEDCESLVILASNLKDNIDQAFTRRFQIVIHFPRPEPDERRRIWEIAFPEGAPLDEEIDFAALARLEMTGAGIVGAACTAALLAARDNSPVIRKFHLTQAVARQYHREARILKPDDLGPYAMYLKEGR